MKKASHTASMDSNSETGSSKVYDAYRAPTLTSTFLGYVEQIGRTAEDYFTAPHLQRTKTPQEQMLDQKYPDTGKNVAWAWGAKPISAYQADFEKYKHDVLSRSKSSTFTKTFGNTFVNLLKDSTSLSKQFHNLSPGVRSVILKLTAQATGINTLWVFAGMVAMSHASGFEIYKGVPSGGEPLCGDESPFLIDANDDFFGGTSQHIDDVFFQTCFAAEKDIIDHGESAELLGSHFVDCMTEDDDVKDILRDMVNSVLNATDGSMFVNLTESVDCTSTSNYGDATSMAFFEGLNPQACLKAQAAYQGLAEYCKSDEGVVDNLGLILGTTLGATVCCLCYIYYCLCCGGLTIGCAGAAASSITGGAGAGAKAKF